MLSRKNLVDELLAQRKRSLTEADLIESVKVLLIRDETQRQAIKQRLNDGGEQDSNSFIFDYLESDRIFHVDQIKAVCVDYRLRFLNSNRFKGQVPEEAVSKIRSLEKQHNTTLSGFKIAAPSKLFKLDNYDDPLLFTPIGNGYYYLVHKWGNDISGWRKLLVRPFRDFGSFLLFLVLVSVMLTFMISDGALGVADVSVMRFICFLFIFKGVCGISLYYCFWKGKNFNTAIWNSDYYNH
ncbi:hypothetical protein FUA48_05410 [Flavobacterium alkalisoli]|uniref:Uncharacterized protein n=1 Tax=Flavobacterium alkalisoli TaxID=2602769 RepID=A0A5B9FQD3_9FLAO|nr:hypothetical protein [Flavobacterium alkalisoli]QEE49035.1 hypothetical protein FUA48_05410 [Flavobacterium alkalisoli]